MFILMSCTTKSLPTSVLGEWTLETITNTSEDKKGEIITVGKAYSSFDDFNGDKKDSSALFNENGTFEIFGLKESFNGSYSIDKELSTKDATAINLDIDDKTKIIATYGIRQYQNDKEVDSLIFTLDEKTYSFIKSATN